jgi:acetyl-CoA carboxylase biotin carboxyl carrier protein
VELKHIKELMAAMGRTGTKRLHIKKEDFELTLEREEQAGVRFIDQNFDLSDDNIKSMQMNRADQALAKGAEMSAGRVTEQPAAGAVKEDANSSFVTSPMVGTYYSSSSPEVHPYVKVGDKVEKTSVVCIIEAMKVMNEIKANIAGTVAEILVENGQPVEFGTKLYRIVGE